MLQVNSMYRCAHSHYEKVKSVFGHLEVRRFKQYIMLI